MSRTAESSAAAQAVSHYTRRAQNYDKGDNQWHVVLGRQYVEATNPRPGARCLDLACGTGLVTFPLAEAAGKDGQVIGIDITPAMLSIAKTRAPTPEWAPIDFIEHDITCLDDVEQVQAIVSEHGGFDLISCCSALMLLSSPAEAIKSWASLLKPGGKLITDVPTEMHILQSILSRPYCDTTGLSNEPHRLWVQDVNSLNRLCTDAGLVIEKSWKTENPPGQYTDYRLEDGERVFEDYVEKYKEFMDLGKINESKQGFLQMWTRRCEQHGGRFRDGPWLYVTIARK